MVPKENGRPDAQQAVGEKIRAFVDRQHDQQVAFLAKLVAMPSDNPPGDCQAHGEAAAALLEGLGFAVERHPVPAPVVRATGMRSALNLVVRSRFGEGPTVALNAHGDVVPPGEGWRKDPYGAEIDAGRLYGRGAAVSKSDFATYSYALLALQAAGVPLAGSVELHFTYDEEAGGVIGPKWLLDEGISRPDYVICAGFSYAVVTSHSGCLHLEVTFKGKQAHAAMPHTGADALEAANGVLSALYEHRRRLTSIHSQVNGIETPALTVGLINGGINTNVVPDKVRLHLDRRLIPEEDATKVEAELRLLIEEHTRIPGTSCEIRRILLAEPLVPIDGSGQLSELLERHASAIMQQTVESHGVPLYTDARHYAHAGIPTVLYGAGPHSILDANAHGADEHLRLDDLRKATQVVALALLELLGSEDRHGQ